MSAFASCGHGCRIGVGSFVPQADSCSAANDVHGLHYFLRSPRDSLQLDIGGPHHLAPLFGVGGDELAEVGR
jgi:hypothetical protein